jgi:hypothetical protein
MHRGLGPRWTNGEDDLYLNEDIRSLVEDLEVKLRVQDAKETKPKRSTEKIVRSLEKGNLCHVSWWDRLGWRWDRQEVESHWWRQVHRPPLWTGYPEKMS